MSKETSNLYQKLAKIRTQVSVLQKDAQGFNYKYVKVESILSKITGLMDKYEISLVPKIISGTTQVSPYSYSKIKTSKQGVSYEDKSNEILVSAEMEWTWVNNTDPEEKIVVPWVIVGQQSDASQAFGSAITYCTRYFLLSYFNIATSNDDPDKLRSEQKQSVVNADRAIADALVQEAHQMLKDFTMKSDENKEAAKVLASRFAKEGNYFTIADPQVAQKFLEEVHNTTKTETST